MICYEGGRQGAVVQLETCSILIIWGDSVDGMLSCLNSRQHHVAPSRIADHSRTKTERLSGVSSVQPESKPHKAW